MELHPEFTITITQKNCRKFFRRIYDLAVPINTSLAHQLADFGKLEMLAFSEKVKGAKDVFQIKNLDGTEISGVLGQSSVYLVLPKQNTEVFDLFEQQLRHYVQLQQIEE